MAARASREEVLAWMDETGLGPGPAADHFGIPKNTIKSWRKRGRDRARRGQTPPPPPPDASPATMRAYLRTAFTNMGRWIATPENADDPRGMNAQISALARLAEAAPKLIKIEQVLDAADERAADGEGPGGDELARIREIFGVAEGSG